MSTYSDEADLSGDETFDDIGNFDIVNLPREEINNRERQFRDLAGPSDDSDSDFEGFQPEDAYQAPDFATWDKIENNRNIMEFNERTGPTRVLDGSNQAIDYFQLFYTDDLLKKIVEYTNLNAASKREHDPDNNRGAWSDTTLEELKAFYGLLLLMGSMIGRKCIGQIIINIGW